MIFISALLSRLFLPLPTPSFLIPVLFLFSLASSQTVVQTITITVQPAIPSEAPSFVDHDVFTRAILNSTNVYRASHNASGVRWNATLEAFASSYLQQPQTVERGLSVGGNEDEKCRMQHSGGPYGENLALGCSTAGSCVEMWGDEAALYDYASPAFAEDTGHFTQLVWRATTDVGCGARLCPGNRGWYLACEYWPRGNVVGAFAEEVGRPEDGTGDGTGGSGSGSGIGSESESAGSKARKPDWRVGGLAIGVLVGAWWWWWCGFV
ncbi:hypothetical protein AAE478_009796 [Parahypoxylon ruwenzoriense]